MTNLNICQSYYYTFLLVNKDKFTKKAPIKNNYTLILAISQI